MKRLNLIAASVALGLAGFAYAGSPPEDTGARQPSTAEQPATTTPPADTAPATEAPSTDASASSDASADNSSSSATSADPQTVPSAPAQSSSAAGPSRSDNPRLAAVTPSGMSAQEACTGFSSTDECATALHIAQNLNIPFADLKSKVTGGEKIAAAIKQLKPDANAKAEVRKAEQQARADRQAPSG